MPMSTTRSTPQTETQRSRSSRSRRESIRPRPVHASTRPVETSARRSMSWVEAELREQPEALARFLEAERDNATTLVRRLVRNDVSYLLIASRGSSGNAARYAQYLFG